ncbi:MAG: polysaccharide biosynthesis tyrosine autokinase [Caulobacteraceae bacterium]
MNMIVEPIAQAQRWPPAMPTLQKLEGAIDLEGVIAAFRRRSRTFFLLIVLSVAAAAFISFSTAPRFTSTTSVMLDMRKQQVVGATQVNVLSDLPPDTSVVDSEVQVIQSRTLADRLISKFNLMADPEFNPALDKPDPFHAIIGRLKAAIPLHHAATPLSPEAARAAERAAVIDTVVAAEYVRREGLTYVIDISFTSHDPQKAAALAAGVADLYLTSQLDAKFDANKRANEWLSRRLAGLRSEVAGTEQAAASYQARNGLLVSTGSSLTEQRVSELQTQEGAARADLAEKQARLRTAQEQLANGGTGEDLGEALDSPVIRDLRVKLADLHQTEAQLSTRYGPRHPNVINAQHEAGEIESAIHAEIQRIVGGLQADVNASSEREKTVDSGLEEARGVLATSKSAQVGLDELQRNADASRTMYTSYLERFKQTSAGDALETSDAQIVSPARMPTQASSPNTKLNLVLGLLSGILLGTVGVFLLESLDAGVRTATDVEQKLNELYLGSVPLVRTRPGVSPADLVVERPLSAFAEAFRHLRVALVRAKLDQKVHTIVVTSALPGEGKTTTTLALARAASTGGNSVVAVDCDLRRRSLTHLVRPGTVEAGLVEVLAGGVRLEDALITDDKTDLKLLPVSSAKFTPREIFGSPAMARLISELNEQFEYVILDCPPVLPIAEAKTLASLGDAVLFLTGWRKTKASAVKHALATLRNANVHVSGVALSKVNLAAQAKHGYGDAAYYYKEYQSYYTE